MGNLLSMIGNINGLLHLKGANDAQIAEAENKLGLKFDSEYKLYLKEFGCVTFGNHELMGLNTSDRLSVVYVTKFERKRKGSFPANMYVLEIINDGDIIIMQNEMGGIFELDESGNSKKIFQSLEAYLENLI